MADALIGYTGFVGSNLARAHRFAASFNSANFREMRGSAFDLVVCAGVSAAKWLANKNPEDDRRQIDALVEILDTMSVKEFVLVSTIDVYPDPGAGGDETTAIDPATTHVYGRHRYELERWVAKRFPGARIVRLPALFGPGLKKNALYDLINANQVELINPAGVFQWYPVVRLWDDIETARRRNLSLVNLFPEPLPMSSIIEASFPDARVGASKQPAPVYRVKTQHAHLFRGVGGYVMSAAESLRLIGLYAARAQRAPRQ